MEINSMSQGRQNITNLNNTSNPSGDIIKENSKEITVNVSKSSYGDKNLEEEVKNAVEGLNKLLKDTDTHIEYEKHDKLNEFVIKIINNETKEVVKEIPPKKILDMVAKMCEMIGIIVDKKV